MPAAVLSSSPWKAEFSHLNQEQPAGLPLTDELPDTTCSGTLTKLLLHIPAVRLASKTNCNEQVCFCFTATAPGVAGKVWCLCYGPVATRPLSPSACWRFDANQSRLLDISVSDKWFYSSTFASWCIFFNVVYANLKTAFIFYTNVSCGLSGR